MESGGWGRCASWDLRIDGLVIVFVRAHLLDVWRERHLPKHVKDFQEDAFIDELHVPEAFRFDGCADTLKLAVSKDADGAFSDAMGIADKALPLIAFKLF